MTDIFDLSGLGEPQASYVREAIAACDFPFELMRAGLAREGKTQFRVEQADLSRYAPSDGKGHEHVHEGDAKAHTIDREVNGRRAVLGLYYLPPYSKIVLERTMNRDLTMEVFGAEVAHGCDYCYMTADMRRAVVNAVHTARISPAHSMADGAVFDLDGHRCSWFDGTFADGRPIPYRLWVGETFMEVFVRAFMPNVPVTIELGHDVGAEDRDVVRKAILPPVPEPAPEPEPTDVIGDALEAALVRFLGTRNGQKTPLYFRGAAEAWLDAR